MPVQTSYSTNSAKAFAGQIVRADLVLAKKNAEASASIPIGSAVVPHASDADGAILPASQGQKVLGFVGRYHNHSLDIDLDSTGLKVGATMDVVVKGAMYVLAEETVAFKGRGYVRCTTGGTAEEVVGGVAAAAESTETIDTSNQIEFQESVTIGATTRALVLVEFDFTRKP